MTNKTSMIGFRVNEQERKEFEELAEKYNLSISALIRFLVRRELNKENEK